MKYYEVNFTIEPYTETYSDVFSALLAEIGFETFVPTDNGLQAYIQQSVFEEENLKQIIGNYPFPEIKIKYEIVEAEYEDWNAVWEEDASAIELPARSYITFDGRIDAPLSR